MDAAPQILRTAPQTLWFLLGLAALMGVSCTQNSFQATTPVAAAVDAPQGEDALVQATPREGLVPAEAAEEIDAPSSAESLSPPKIFNAAMLTREPTCIFCHTRIYGDIGGIDFDASLQEVTNVKLYGRLFANAAIPPGLQKIVEPAKQFPSYQNKPIAIFPEAKDGKVRFPLLSATALRGKVQGKLKLGGTVVNKEHRGNLSLVAKPGEAIEIDGEVFIDGIVVLAGTYKGVGTIYAQSVYIVDDLKAASSVFPYPEDEAVAMAKAAADVAAGRDALRIGAIRYVNIGDPDQARSPFVGQFAKAGAAGVADQTPIDLAKELPELYKVTERAQLLALTTPFTGSVSVNPPYDQGTWLDATVVEAFLYSSNAILWRSRAAPFVLHGGFIAPNLMFVSRAGTDIWGGPANKEKPNIIRYDYRLRAGGGGFEAIRDLF